MVAATPEKSKTYVFDDAKVRDREVGGSNPLAPTNNLHGSNFLRSPLSGDRFSVWPICGQDACD